MILCLSDLRLIEIFYIIKKLNKEIFDLNTQNQKKSEILSCMQFNNSIGIIEPNSYDV